MAIFRLVISSCPRFTGIVTAGVLLAGCGQMGPLYIDDQKSDQSSVQTTQAGVENNTAEEKNSSD